MRHRGLYCDEPYRLPLARRLQLLDIRLRTHSAGHPAAGQIRRYPIRTGDKRHAAMDSHPPQHRYQAPTIGVLQDRIYPRIGVVSAFSQQLSPFQGSYRTFRPRDHRNDPHSAGTGPRNRDVNDADPLFNAIRRWCPRKAPPYNSNARHRGQPGSMAFHATISANASLQPAFAE